LFPPAPVGHRQPTAADVPPDDAVGSIPTPSQEPRAARQGRLPDSGLDRGVPKVCVGCGR
jgi:hypothetical protein